MHPVETSLGQRLTVCDPISTHGIVLGELDDSCIVLHLPRDEFDWFQSKISRHFLEADCFTSLEQNLLSSCWRAQRFGEVFPNQVQQFICSKDYFGVWDDTDLEEHPWLVFVLDQSEGIGSYDGRHASNVINRGDGRIFERCLEDPCYLPDVTRWTYGAVVIPDTDLSEYFLNHVTSEWGEN